jgi:hypothetical protein
MHHAAAGFLGFGLLGTFLIIPGLVIAYLVTWIKSLIDVINSNFQKENDKQMWLLLLILTGPLGTVLYLTVGKKNKEITYKKPAPTPRVYTAKPILKNIQAEICSKCGNTMKERTVMSGEKAGQKFLVCSKYPECKFMSPLEA